MRNVLLGLLLAVVFIVGCLVGGVTRQFVVPPVRAGTKPARWEHYCFRADSVGKIQRRSNQLGQAGFEMVAAAYPGVGQIIWCFKRPLP